jgi:hypothetical protein
MLCTSYSLQKNTENSRLIFNPSEKYEKILINKFEFVKSHEISRFCYDLGDFRNGGIRFENHWN